MDEPVAVVGDVLRTLDLVGVLANGLLGGVVARRFGMDPVGIAVLAVISALGGGAIRDVLLDQRPAAVDDPLYLTVALGAAAVAFLVPMDGRRWRQVFPWVDAAALGTWAVAGTEKSLIAGVSPLPAILLGVLTAVGGGAVRDVILGQVPTIFRRSELYATCAFVAGVALVLLREGGAGVWAAPVAAAVGMWLCLLARHKGWVLPTEPRLPRTWTVGTGNRAGATSAKGVNRRNRSRGSTARPARRRWRRPD